MKKTIFKDFTYTNTPIKDTPLNADTFNDIWNAIECIDYRQRKLEEQMNSRRIESIKIIILVIIAILCIILATLRTNNTKCECSEIQAKEYENAKSN